MQTVVTEAIQSLALRWWQRNQASNEHNDSIDTEKQE